MKKKNYVLWVWRMAYPLLAYWVMTTAVMTCFELILIFQAKSANMDMQAMINYINEMYFTYSQYLMLLCLILAFPFLYFLMRSDKIKREKANGVLIYEKTTPNQYALIVIFAIAYSIGANKLIEFSGIPKMFPGFDEVADLLYSSGFLLQTLTIVIGAPIIEEMLFRGILYNRMKEHCKVRTAIIISGILFGIYHLNMVQAVYAGFLGIALAYAYEKFHTIWVPILCHAAANAISVLMANIEFLKVLTSNLIFGIVATIISVLAIAFVLIKIKNVEQKCLSACPTQQEESTSR